MHSIEAVLFDFNGVIVDDEPVHDEAWRETLAPLGVSYTRDEYYGPLLGVPDYEFVRLLLEMRGLTMSPARQLVLQSEKSAVYDRIVRARELTLPGLHEFVRDLAAHAALGVVSGALRSEIDEHLTRLGLADCFAAIVAAGEYPATKPDPAPYVAGLAALARVVGRSFEPARTLAIEDSTNGMLSARAAGMPVLGVVARVPRERLPDCFACVSDFRGLTFAELAHRLG